MSRWDNWFNEAWRGRYKKTWRQARLMLGKTGYRSPCRPLMAIIKARPPVKLAGLTDDQIAYFERMKDSLVRAGDPQLMTIISGRSHIVSEGECVK
jgi:hypothetical protein